MGFHLHSVWNWLTGSLDNTNYTVTMIFNIDDNIIRNIVREMLKAMMKGKFLIGPSSYCIPVEVVTFRANHVLAETYNASMRTVLFLFLLTSGIAHILSAVTLIVQTSSDSVPFLVNMFFAAIVPETVLIHLIVFGFGADFYRFSDLSLKQLKQSVLKGTMQIKDRKYLQRIINSIQVGKVKFGLSNFIDKTTPPIFQLFCLNRIIDILLVR